MTKGYLAAAAAAFTGIQVGVAMVLSQMVLPRTGPVPLAMLRYLIGVFVLIPFLARDGFPRFAIRDVGPITLLGICQFGLLIALLNFGLKHVVPARAALVFSSIPLLALSFGIVLGRERATLAKVGGVVVCIVGVGVGLGRSLLTSGNPGQIEGALSVLAAAMCGAICSVLYRPYLQRYTPLHVGAYAMASSVVVLAIWSAILGFFPMLYLITARDWFLIIIVGGSSGLAYVMLLWALKSLDASRVLAFWTLSPVAASLLGGLLGGSAGSSSTFVGLGLICLGIIVVLSPLGQVRPAVAATCETKAAGTSVRWTA